MEAIDLFNLEAPLSKNLKSSPENFDKQVRYLNDIFESIKISDQEKFDLTDQRESNMGTIRNLIEVILNSILRNIIQLDKTINSYLIFGNNEPTFEYLMAYLLQHSNSIPINAYQLVNQLTNVIKNWPKYIQDKNNSSQFYKIAQNAYHESHYYFKNQIRTKLGEGIRLDSEDLKFKAYLESLFDGNSELIKNLSLFINEYDLRQRISTHSLTYNGANNIKFLRSHFDVYSDLPYLTREPIENRNLRLLELLKNAENSVVIEISPPFYKNENEFILRYSIFENGEWKITSIFLPIKRISKDKIDYKFVKEFAEELNKNITKINELDSSRVIKTSKKTDNKDSEKKEMLELFSKVNYLKFKENINIQNSLENLINKSFRQVYGLGNGMQLLKMNDQYVGSTIEGNLMCQIDQYASNVLKNVLEKDKKQIDYLADQYGTVVHMAKTTLLPESELNKKNYTQDDKEKIKSGSFLAAAIKNGRSGVNELVKTLTTEELSSTFESSCGVTNEKFGNKVDAKSIDTTNWTSTSEVQHINGIGNFIKVTKIDPNNSENKIVLYRCNICDGDGIDSCSVMDGCFKCNATYGMIVEKAREEVNINAMTENDTPKKTADTKPISKPATLNKSTVAPSKTADSLANGFINMLSFGIASKVQEA